MEMATAKELQDEQTRSQQIHQAWEKAKQAEKNPTAQSVVVVKTIAKQARKEQRQQRQNIDEDNSASSLKHRAKEYLRIAAYKYDHPIALVQLGTMVLQEAKASTDAVDKRQLVHGALDLFQRAGQNGSRVGWFNYGQLLWSGFPANQEVEENDETEATMNGNEMILETNEDKAIGAFEKAIGLGDPDAMYLVGVHRMSQYSDDDNDGEEHLVNSGSTISQYNNDGQDANVRKTVQSGYDLINQSASLGHGGALYYLALLHLNGERQLGIPSSVDEFVRYLDESCGTGNGDALFTRGYGYYHGSDGYSQDYSEALRDFLRAAEEGRHADAAVSAGAMLHTGIDGIIRKDQEKAFELYQNAGEWGSKEGWQNVVACYIAGEGVPQSLETAEYIAETMLKTKLFQSKE